MIFKLISINNNSNFLVLRVILSMAIIFQNMKSFQKMVCFHKIIFLKMVLERRLCKIVGFRERANVQKMDSFREISRFRKMERFQMWKNIKKIIIFYSVAPQFYEFIKKTKK